MVEVEGIDMDVEGKGEARPRVRCRIRLRFLPNSDGATMTIVMTL